MSREPERWPTSAGEGASPADLGDRPRLEVAEPIPELAEQVHKLLERNDLATRAAASPFAGFIVDHEGEAAGCWWPQEAEPVASGLGNKLGGAHAIRLDEIPTS
jgi:hypothetical protein